MAFDKIQVPADGEKITVNADNSLTVPDQPIIPYIEGDGIGSDVTPVMLNVVEAAVEMAYADRRHLRWMPVFAGQRATEVYGSDVVPQDGPIPAHLLGNMWSQDWVNVSDLVVPEAAAPLDLTALLRAHGMDARKMVKQAEKFFVSLGLAPLLVQQIRDIIVEINQQGTSVLLIEQNANMALSIADYGYIMETGKVVMDGDPKKLLRDEDVQEFYLGLHGEGERKSFRKVKHYKRRKRWLS